LSTHYAIVYLLALTSLNLLAPQLPRRCMILGGKLLLARCMNTPALSLSHCSLFAYIRYSSVNDLSTFLSFLFRDNISYGSSPAQILDGQTIKEWLQPGYVTGVTNGGVLILLALVAACLKLFLD